MIAKCLLLERLDANWWVEYCLAAVCMNCCKQCLYELPESLVQLFSKEVRINVRFFC